MTDNLIDEIEKYIPKSMALYDKELLLDNIKIILDEHKFTTPTSPVDELVDKRTKAEGVVAKSGYILVDEFISDLKSLKQTPVKDSQPKEVEIKKIKNVYQDCPNCEQDNCLILNDMNYCPGCGSKIKWIA